MLIELEQLAMSMIVLTAIVLGTGEPLTWYWLLAIPALLLQAVFNVGMGLFLARLGAGADDFSQLHAVPGPDLDVHLRRHVQHPDDRYTGHRPTLTYLLQINPAAVYISLIRNAILRSQRLAWPGSQPYNAPIAPLPSPRQAKLVNASAYCHGTVTITELWIYGAGWAIVALVVGFLSSGRRKRGMAVGSGT